MPQSTPGLRLRWLKQVTSDHGTSSMDFEVAFHIADHVNNMTGQAWPGKPRLSRLAKVSTKTIQRSIRRLGLLGHLRTILVPRRGNIYELIIQNGNAENGAVGVDRAVAERGHSRSPRGDGFAPQTYIEPIQVTAKPVSDKDARVLIQSDIARLSAWKWGSSERLVGSLRQADYQKHLEERIGENAKEIISRLPEPVLENLLQRMREGTLNSSDLSAARRIAAHAAGLTDIMCQQK